MEKSKNKGQDYLFVTNIDIFLNTVRLNDKKEDGNDGELFYPEDFEPYRKMVNQVYVTMLMSLVKQGLITVGDIKISEYKDAVNPDGTVMVLSAQSGYLDLNGLSFIVDQNDYASSDQ